MLTAKLQRIAVPKRFFTSLFFSLFFLVSLYSQDPIFSQFYAAPFQINPAFVGNTYAPKISLNYRDQWRGFNSAYQTASLTYEQFVPLVNSGFALNITADAAGDGVFKTNAISGFYTYRLKVKENLYFKWGFEASVVQSKLDWNKLIFTDQIDSFFGAFDNLGNPNPTLETPPDKLRNTYLDVSTGLIVYSTKWYGGFSLKHITTPDNRYWTSFSNLNDGLPVRTTFHAGSQFELFVGNKSIRTAFISPNLVYTKQGDFSQVNVGAFARVGRIFAGAWYRHSNSNSDAPIFLVGVEEGIMKIGYSYDYTISQLGGNTGGSHEISVVFNFDNSAVNRRKRNRPDYNDCFQLFR
ncbi:MAG: PorP/SprF family type IX secretion system membrane protein [Bacteroidia bacterium]|nr:PorP/SprF family type IX secretion system membrane protein [Bacteroidia bacterium]